MALIGPGSEWLWAMLQFLALATTFIAIYRQLRLRRDASTIEQLSGMVHE